MTSKYINTTIYQENCSTLYSKQMYSKFGEILICAWRINLKLSGLGIGSFPLKNFQTYETKIFEEGINSVNKVPRY